MRSGGCPCTPEWSCSSPSGTSPFPPSNVGEKPTVILYTYINRHAGTPEKKRKEKKRKEKKRKEKKRKEKKRKDVVVVFHIQRIGCQPEKTTLHNVWVQNAPQNDVTKTKTCTQT